MTARLISRAGIALMTVVAFAVGVVIGTITTPQHVDRLIHCSVEHAPGWPPCPPTDNRAVWAVWEGGLTTTATWDGRSWRLTQPVIGQARTSEHPTAWGEL